MKKNDPTGLRGVNGFSYEAFRRSEQEERNRRSGRPLRGTIRIAVVAIVLSAMFTYGFLRVILTPVASNQVRTK
ncbi:hypothetical protein [Collimonas silvisoli]|uniref:hypothetical protein n=1 Tax=Collimonas silvisoli TaxID=2825884 RepID=UPI001B8B8F1A|nr:hypothetical protein [Collimonas silvisoli]